MKEKVICNCRNVINKYIWELSAGECLNTARIKVLFLTCMSLVGSVVFAQGAGILFPGHMEGIPRAEG